MSGNVGNYLKKLCTHYLPNIWCRTTAEPGAKDVHAYIGIDILKALYDSDRER